MPQRQRTTHKSKGRQRNISVRAIRKDSPDARKLSRAVIELALAQAEADAAAQAAEERDRTQDAS